MLTECTVNQKICKLQFFSHMEHVLNLWFQKNPLEVIWLWRIQSWFLRNIDIRLSKESPVMKIMRENLENILYSTLKCKEALNYTKHLICYCSGHEEQSRFKKTALGYCMENLSCEIITKWDVRPEIVMILWINTIIQLWISNVNFLHWLLWLIEDMKAKNR